MNTSLKYVKKKDRIETKNYITHLGKSSEIEKMAATEKFFLKTHMNSEKNFKFELKSKNDYIFKCNEKSNIKISEMKNKNELNSNNEHMQNIINENNNYNNIKESYWINNKLKNKINYKYKSTHTKKYLIIYILLCLFCNINSQINKVNKIIMFYSYEITLKVKGTGTKNILSSSSSHIYPCPSKIYLNNRLVSASTIQDCHYIDMIKSDTIIKMEWNGMI